jgi:hypothetical protein
MAKKEKEGYYGRYYSNENGKSDKKPKMIWIGPLTEREMEDDFYEFRHNFKEKISD